MNYPWLDDYFLGMQGATKDFKVEWQWTRYLVGNKMFAAICKDKAGKDVIVTLKLDPMDGDFLRSQYENIKPGYYMNKIHWNSVDMDGCVPDEVLREMGDKSYRLVLGKLSKKMQKEISELSL